jgi:hypothetical protein
MVFNFDEVGTLMDEIADSFPEAFYERLNGSVLLLPDVKRDPEARDLSIMGAYIRDQLGRHIEIYYGSFVCLAKSENWSEEDWRQELWDTLAHEFTHHLESLAGEWSLEEKDEAFMEHYWSQKNRKKKQSSSSSQNP